MSRPGEGHDRRSRGRGTEGHRPRRDGGVGRHRDPRLLLRAATRPARRRLSDVPRRGGRTSQAPGRLHAHGAGRDGRQDRSVLREGRGRPERDARVHPRQPSARLPCLRQGRRVPAAGPDVPLRAGQHAHVVLEDHAGEADSGLSADRARPRAVHPLLPVHAVLVRRRRGLPARRPQPRRPHRDRHVRERPVSSTVLRKRDRALPRRGAHVDAVPLRGAAVGHSERADRLWALLGRMQHQRDGARGQGQADPLPQSSRGRRRLALRQGPVHVSAPDLRGSHHRAARAGRARPGVGHLGYRPRSCRGAPS